MADGLNIKVNAKLDVGSTTKQIQTQLSEVAKNIQPIQLNAKIDTDSIKQQTQQIQSQINSAVSNTSSNTKPISLDNVFKFDTHNMTKLMEQLTVYKNELSKLSDISPAKLSTHTNSLGNIDSAKFTYFNDRLKSSVTEVYELDKASKEANSSVNRLALTGTTYSTNAYNAAQQTEKFSQQLQAFKTTVNSFGDKNVGTLLDSNSLGTQYQKLLTGLDSVKDNNGLNAVKNQFKDLQAQTISYIQDQRTLKTEVNNTTNSQIKDFEILTKSEQQRQAEIQKTSNSISELSAKYKLLNIQVEKSGIGSLNTENITGFQNAINSNNIQQATHYLSLLRIEYQQLNAEMSKKLPQNAIDNMQDRAKSLSTQIDQITAKFSTLNTTGDSNFTKNFSTQIEQANSSIKELQTNLNTFNTAKTEQEQVTAFNQLNSSVKDSKTQVNDLVKAYQTLNRIEASAGSFEKYLKQNPQVLKKHAQQVNEIRNQWKQVAQETDITKLQTSFREATTATSAFKGEIRSLGEEGRTVFGELGNDLKKQLQWLTSGTLLFGTIAVIKDMYSEIVKLDDQMVELRKVTDESEATYSKFYNTANETAKSLGVTTESVIGATAAWAQMGYNLPDSTELAKDSEIFKNISENMTVDEATNSLISTLKAFKISSGDVLDGVISKVNEVGNRFAVTNKDIAEGLERSASSMAVANNSMDQTIALLTAATEVTRDADSAGTALKTEFCLCVQKCA